MTPDAEARINRARLLLLDAMLDPGEWEAALDAVADACGGRAGQLLALDGDKNVVGHWISGVPEGFTHMIEAYGFADPVGNPRFRMGLAAPLMTLAADQDYLNPEERRRSPIYAEIYEPSDLPFNCQVVLERDEQAFVRASVTRSRKQGPLDDEAFRAFAALTPHLHAAVRVQASLISAQCTATLLTLDSIGAAAFLLSETGRVLGVSAAADALAGEGGIAHVFANRLRFCAQADQSAYEAALACVGAAARGGKCVAPAPIHLSAGAGVLDLQMLPRQRNCFSGAPAMLAIVRPAKPRERARALQGAFGLTPAEAEVAVALAEGEALEGIAARRRVALATVRSQVQSAYTKMDVHRQAELAALVGRFGGL